MTLILIISGFILLTGLVIWFLKGKGEDEPLGLPPYHAAPFEEYEESFYEKKV